MSAFATLVGGGADCGPVNPLSQLSKVYGADRGVQQDHYNPQAGPSKSAFRQYNSGGNQSHPHPHQSVPDEAARFYQQQRPHQQIQPGPFDLSPLNRALTPSSSSQHQHQPSQIPTPPPPAWAQAFVHSDPSLMDSLGGGVGGGLSKEQQQANFSRAFRTGSPSLHSSQQHTPNEWTNDFQIHNGGGGVGSGKEREHLSHISHLQHHHPPPPGQTQMHHNGSSSSSPYSVERARLYNGGMGMGMGMGMGVGNGTMMGLNNRMSTPPQIQLYPGASMALEPVYEAGLDRHQERIQTSQASDWETAFLAQEDSVMSSSIMGTTTETDLRHTVNQNVAMSPQARSSSPGLTEEQSRDALAQTAGALLDTVQTTERQRTNGESRDSATGEDRTRDKFAQSAFLDLMRKLRDGEVAVEGDKVVEQIGPARTSGVGAGNAITGLDKGKGKESSWSTDFNSREREEEGRVGAQLPSQAAPGDSALAEWTRAQHAYAERKGFAAQMARDLQKGFNETAGLWDDEDEVREARENQEQSHRKVQFQGDGGGGEEAFERDEKIMRMDTSVPLASSAWEEDLYDPSMISGGHMTNNPLRSATRAPSEQQKEWDVLQQDWDKFEATATGFAPVNSTSTSTATDHAYTFAQNNPYIDSTRTHAMHASARSFYDSILAQEAAVQHNPLDSRAWLALGIKQQENEREEMAIQALTRALELDPTIGEAYLALAISYTNENERSLAYDSIDRWIDNLAPGKYSREIENYRDLFGKLPEGNLTERHNYLTGLLIRLAQSQAEMNGTDVDADVQIGLGVLFNTSEEYEKAGDCFESALSVRPDDPLLFNRLGATYANSGKTELAIQYYIEALQIQPGYVRARFNLAVANMNLSQYQEAVEQLITSLSIQEADADMEGQTSEKSGVTSQALWDSLNIALLMMHRSELAAHTADRNLAALRAAFPSSF